MNNEEARFLLQGYRHDGRDARDPQFEEALAQVKRDPVLEQWFREQQSFDSAIADKLNSVPVPASLKASILAGQKTLRPSAWWMRRPVLSALAACFVVMLGLAALFLSLPGQGAFDDYRGDMVNFVKKVEARQESLSLKSSEVADIQDWIAQNSIHKNVALPARLTADAGIGCRVLEWNGQTVTLACFHLEGGQVAHVLVINRNSLRGTPDEKTRYLASLNGMNTVAWSDPTRTYLVVSHAPAEVLEQLL